ncbi:HAD hydrolase-like protein [Methylobacterium sp. BTF04]|uniref:HAD hydrolase-like protein n=1 Tax=Methylobacterium sp. BTF04 TaxID=2708300 RepID=UPI001FEF91BB|nr:HAD hydrolase-like protein [Methylobacterium sp. BTF04]
MSPLPFRLVVFDFDGTLADSFPWFASILNEVATRYRFQRIAEDDTEMLRGLDARAIIRHLGIPAWKLPFITRNMHALATRDIAAIHLFPGITAMLDALTHSGIRLAIVSSNVEPNIRTVLGPREAGLIGHYACGASLFGKARRLRSLIRTTGERPADILYIGDEIRDAVAARDAGCAFGAVAWGYTRLDALAKCDPALIFQTPRDISASLAKIPVASPSVTNPQHPG